MILTVLASVESKTPTQEKQKLKAGEKLLNYIKNKKVCISVCVQVLLGYLSKSPSSLRQKRQKRAAAMFLLTLVQESPNLSVANRVFAVEAVGGNMSCLFETVPYKAIEVAEGILKDQNAPLVYQRKPQLFLENNKNKKRKKRSKEL